MIAGTVIFEIVIAAQAGDMGEFAAADAARAEPARAVHPGHHHMRREGLDFAPEGAPRGDIGGAAKGKRDGLKPAFGQGRHPWPPFTHQHMLLDAGARQGQSQAHEKRLGAAMLAAGDGLQQAQARGTGVAIHRRARP